MNPRLFIIFSIGIVVAVGCSRTQPQAKTPESEKTKNVIMIIGDGMGPQQNGAVTGLCQASTSFSGQKQDDRA